MSKVLRFLKNTSETTAAAVLAAAIVVVETYESLRKKVNTVRSS